ncbi:MAG TPA: OmpA family protein [Longimicrobium sp.]|jgi:peptidoglycan-associated lipoprotein|nr:OmpA family protein [Longimicrobium sp.]
MKLRHAAPLLLVPLALAGCKKKRPAVPTPAVDTTATLRLPAGTGAPTDAERERMRNDSVTLVEEARERERRAREAAVAVARDALTDIVFFEYDSDEITSAAEGKLASKAAVLRANPGVRLRIEGHADQRGSTEYNLALGQRRAEAVRAYLVNLGIDVSRLSTLSYGKERPLVEGEDEDAFARNRRAEFTVAGGTLTTVPAELRR